MKKKLSELFVEYDRKYDHFGNVFMSNNRPATRNDIRKANELKRRRKCPHNVFWDEAGFIYDIRHCYTCGKMLGFI